MTTSTATLVLNFVVPAILQVTYPAANKIHILANIPLMLGSDIVNCVGKWLPIDITCDVVGPVATVTVEE